MRGGHYRKNAASGTSPKQHFNDGQRAHSNRHDHFISYHIIIHEFALYSGHEHEHKRSAHSQTQKTQKTLDSTFVSHFIIVSEVVNCSHGICRSVVPFDFLILKLSISMNEELCRRRPVPNCQSLRVWEGTTEKFSIFCRDSRFDSSAAKATHNKNGASLNKQNWRTCTNRTTREEEAWKHKEPLTTANMSCRKHIIPFECMALMRDYMLRALSLNRNMDPWFSAPLNCTRAFGTGGADWREMIAHKIRLCVFLLFDLINRNRHFRAINKYVRWRIPCPNRMRSYTYAAFCRAQYATRKSDKKIMWLIYYTICCIKHYTAPSRSPTPIRHLWALLFNYLIWVYSCGYEWCICFASNDRYARKYNASYTRTTLFSSTECVGENEFNAFAI